MLTMISTLWAASGLNKLWPYILLIVLGASAVMAAYLEGRKTGGNDAKQKQLSDSLSNLQKEAKERADIQSMKSSAAREALKKKWSTDEHS